GLGRSAGWGLVLCIAGSTFHVSRLLLLRVLRYEASPLARPARVALLGGQTRPEGARRPRRFLSCPPPHGFLGHRIGGMMPRPGGVHEHDARPAQELRAGPLVVAAED